MNLSVIIPFYNEEKYLETSVNRVLEIKNIEKIFLVNDGSTDDSLNIANKLANQNEIIEILSSASNFGKGNALKIAKQHIKTSHVVIHDADLEYFPEDIQEMFDVAIKNPSCLILGTRFKGIKSRKNLYFRTLVANRGLSFLFSIVFFNRVSDIATCYKLMPVEFFKNYETREKGFSIEVELLAKFLKTKNKIKEVPIKYEGRSYEQGKKIGLKDGFIFIYTIFKYRFVS
jgi:glycosyltransferase involved in cell wall biosynthesis